MALAAVFVLSSGFVSEDEAVGEIVKTKETVKISEAVVLESFDFIKICRYRFVNSEGETLDTVDIVVASGTDCNSQELRDQATAEYNRRKASILPG